MIDGTVCGYKNHDTFGLIAILDNTYDIYIEITNVVNIEEWDADDAEKWITRNLKSRIMQEDESIDWDEIDWQEIADHYKD